MMQGTRAFIVKPFSEQTTEKLRWGCPTTQSFTFSLVVVPNTADEAVPDLARLFALYGSPATQGTGIRSLSRGTPSETAVYCVGLTPASTHSTRSAKATPSCAGEKVQWP